MWIEIIIALVCGVISGTFTGLAPGIHINLVSAFLISVIDKLPFAPISLAIFIVAMSITHTFIDFIPSIFLGAPEEDTFLSILPGHEMFREGLAQKAVIITFYGCIFAIILILLSTPLFIKFLPLVYQSAVKFIPFLLIFISFYLIFREENILLGIVSFVLAGFLGLSAFNLPVKDPLLPLLSGLFGVSSLIVSLKSNSPPLPQKIFKLKEISFERKELVKASIASSIFPLFSFLPGIGSGHAALFGSELVPQKRKGFLFLTGVASTCVMGLSFITLYAINKTRSGTAAAVSNILKEISFSNLLYILSAILISGVLAFIIGFQLSKIFAKYINKINYKKMSLLVILIIIIVNIFFSNFLGIIVLITSTALGVFIILSGSRRVNMMGALIIPTISYYLIG